MKNRYPKRDTTMLPDIERELIGLLSGEVEDKTIALLDRMDKELSKGARKNPNSDDWFKFEREIRLKYWTELCHMIKSYWDRYSWEDQLIFYKYFYEPKILIQWMDECQITATKLMF